MSAQFNAMGYGVPSAGDFSAGRVTNPDQSEVIRQRFYDFQLYAGAGQQLLSFFALPIGQGLTTTPGATAGTPKTKFDTNLQMPNTLPSGKAFAVQQIEVYFFPGSVSTANTFTLVNPSQFNAAASASPLAAGADVFTFYSSGNLEVSVLDKIYVSETPLGCFPPQVATTVDVAIATNSATVGEVGFSLTRQIGRPYVFDIPFTLYPAQNFSVNLNWPGLVPLPSGFNGRVGVVLDGYFMRASQ